MINRIRGNILELKDNAVVVDVNGIGYEVFIPQGIMKGFSETGSQVEFITYHYHQVDQAKSIPVLVGFLNEIEKEFFEKFITVSGI
ncbi:MAG: Holliday junction branch migration protein RuvA, partial [Candidatus Heimdallarchaeota archaeon]|nr:Holliday junction branch migration protein RuvA [Candidatus Heimdallarchaeota archaeon]